jgi:hypothetical protein
VWGALLPYHYTPWYSAEVYRINFLYLFKYYITLQWFIWMAITYYVHNFNIHFVLENIRSGVMGNTVPFMLQFCNA